MTIPTNALKKILYVHHGKGLGGAPLSLLYLIQNLDKNLYEPVVLFLHDSPAVELFRQHNIAIAGIVNRYDFAHTAIWWHRWYHLSMLARAVYDTFMTFYYDAPHWLNKIKPDLIHLNTSSLIAWGKAAHKMGIPVIWHIREPLAQGYFGIRKTLVQSSIKKYASAIIAISHNEAKPWHQEPTAKVIYNAVDSNKFNYVQKDDAFARHYHINKSNPIILFLGGLSQEKGTLVLLKAFDQLLNRLPEAQLLLAGYFDQTRLTNKKFSPSKTFYNEVATLYKKNAKNIHLLGAIHTVPQAMQLADVITFPATVGHFARPVIEAGFMKKPVIASSLAPLDELVEHNHTGYLIAPTDIEGWAEKLYLLLTDKQLNQQLGENNYQFCKKNFEVKEQIKKIEKIYQNLLAKRTSYYGTPNP